MLKQSVKEIIQKLLGDKSKNIISLYDEWEIEINKHPEVAQSPSSDKMDYFQRFIKKLSNELNELNPDIKTLKVISVTEPVQVAYNILRYEMYCSTKPKNMNFGVLDKNEIIISYLTSILFYAKGIGENDLKTCSYLNYQKVINHTKLSFEAISNEFYRCWEEYCINPDVLDNDKNYTIPRYNQLCSELKNYETYIEIKEESFSIKKNLKRIKNQQKKLYANIIVLFGIFISIFSIISINVNYFVNVEKFLPNISINENVFHKFVPLIYVNSIVVISILALVLIIRFLLLDTLRDKRDF